MTGVEILYNKLFDIEDLEEKWYVIFDTNDGHSYSFPLKSVPPNFYEFVSVDGIVSIENIDKMFDMSQYDLEGNKVEDIRIVENVVPRLAKHFYKDRSLTKVLAAHREFIQGEIKKFEEQYENWMKWMAECNENPKLMCRDCNIPLYNSKEHFESTQVQFVICENCSYIPQGKVCETKGCSNFVNRNMVSGEPYPKCFACFNKFRQGKISVKTSLKSK